MSATDDVKKVKKKLKLIMDYQLTSASLINLRYAALALNDFRKEQKNNAYWTNRASIAVDSMFSDKFENKYEIGWFLSHGVDYGVYLELANDKKYAAINKTIKKFVSEYLKDIKEVFSG